MSVTDVEPLTYKIAEAAAALGVSESLMYELTERGDMPCVRLGRRKAIPRRAVEMVIEQAMAGFDPDEALAQFSPVPCGGASGDGPPPPLPASAGGGAATFATQTAGRALDARPADNNQPG